MINKLSKIILSLVMVCTLICHSGQNVYADELSDIELIKDRLIEYFLTLDTIDDGSKVETCLVSKAEDYLALIRDDGSFADVDYKSTTNAANGVAWSPYLALDRLQAIAIAYHKVGNALYHKQEVVDKLNLAIQHWETQNPRSTNWWENQVGVQLRFSRIALFMENIISDNAMDIILTKLLEKSPVKYGKGQNNLWFDQNHVYHAILTENGSRLKELVKDYLSYCLSVQFDDTTAEAIQVDNSFYMHGRQFYSNGYGMSMFRDMSFWMYMLRDTEFAFGQEVIDRMADYMIDGTSWTIRGDILELYLGYRENKYSVGYEDYAAEYIEPLKRMIAVDNIRGSQYQKILDNITGISSSNGKDGFNYMWRSAYASLMRDGYGVNVKMDSDTIIGGEWRGSWSGQSDGGQLIYWSSSAVNTVSVDGDEYIAVYPTYDWGHLPGATTPARVVKDYSNSGRFTNGNDHTIGVSNGKYGSTAYVMNKKGTEATKGYFFFEDEYVALGAGIKSTESTVIHTTLNQSKADNVIVGGNTINKGTTDTAYTTKWLYNDDIGYVFLTDTDVVVSNAKQSNPTLWTQEKVEATLETFKAYINHGTQPTNGSYSYIVVPNKTASEVAAYADDNDIVVVSNTNKVQAVRHDGLKITQVNFYEAGSLEYKDGNTITVDKPCNVIIDESGSSRLITLAMTEREGNETVNVKINSTTTTFVTKGVPYAGQSITLSEGEDLRYTSSSSTQNHSVLNCIDGNEETYFESTGKNDEWVSLYTGGSQYIKELNILWGNNFASQYDVYISTDGTNYSKIASVTDGDGAKDVVSINKVAKYIKLEMTQSSGNNYQIKEVTYVKSELLSLNKEITTSSVSTYSAEAATFVGALAVDGDLSTRWASKRASENEWAIIDLGQYSSINVVEIAWEAAASNDYTIYVSSDCENWTQVASQASDSDLLDQIVFDEPAYGRYIKIYSTDSKQEKYGINVYEISVYGNKAVEPSDNLALNKNVVASNTNGEQIASLAVDGKGKETDGSSLESRWAVKSSNKNVVETFTVDLGTLKDINKVVISWENNQVTKYDIKVSTDGSTYTTIKSVNSTGTVDEVLFDTTKARYVRMETVSRTGQWCSFWEFEVYNEVKQNVALNKHAEASSEYNSKNPASLAVDGSVENNGNTFQSRWCSKRTDNEWFLVDLGSRYEITEIVLKWEGAYGKQYKLEVSDDKATWTEINNITASDGGTDAYTYSTPITGRYVRMNGSKAATKYGYSLWEFEVYGKAVEENVALNKTTKSSSDYKSQHSSNKVVDGDADTRWVSLREKDNASLDKNQWIQVDLAQKCDLHKVVLKWEGERTNLQYNLQTSLDGTTWENVAYVTNGNAGNDIFMFDDGTQARYIRMYGIEPSGVYGYSLWEVEVYGELQQEVLVQSVVLSTNNNVTAINRKGEKLQINASITPTDATNTNLKWEVFDENGSATDKATIDEHGLLTPIKNGKVKVVATTTDGTAIYDDILITLTNQDLTNVALNKDSEASWSYTNPNSKFKLESQYAFDGSVENRGDAYQSRWVSARKEKTDVSTQNYDQQYVLVDLGAKYDISKIVLDWEGSAAKEYKLLVSNDKSTWTEYVHVTDGNNNTSDKSHYIMEFYKDVPVTARYVKMQGIEVNNKYGYSLWEFEVYGRINKDELQALYNETLTINTDLYTPNSVTTLIAAMTAAQTVLQTVEPAASTLTTVLEKLQQAKDELVLKADKDELNAVIDETNALDLTKYTPNSQSGLQEALEAAENVYADDNATQVETEQVTIALRNVLNNLVLKADKGALNAVIDETNALDLTKYTPNSQSGLQEALEAAENIYADDNATQVETAMAVKELKDILKALVLRADKSNLSEKKDEVTKLDLTIYTDDSVNELTSILNKVNEIISDENAHQNDVDLVLAQLDDALAKLVKQDNKPVVKPNTSDDSFVVEYLLLTMISLGYIFTKRKRYE